MSEPLEVTVKVIWDESRVRRLWCNILGGGWEYCSWWREVRYAEGADWDKPGKVTLWVDHPDFAEGTKEKRKTISPKDVVEALYKAMEKGYVDACTGSPIFEEMSWDQCSSDVILQIAVLGEVVYG